MKTNQLTLMLTAFAALTLFIAACQPKPEKPATAEALSQVNRDFMKAMNAKDAVAAASYYADEASVLPPGEAIITGRAAIQKYWQGFLDGASFIDGSCATIATGSSGDVGYEIGTAELHLKGPDGKIVTENIKYTLVLKRNADGKWLQMYDMWNPVAAPAVGQ